MPGSQYRTPQQTVSLSTGHCIGCAYLSTANPTTTTRKGKQGGGRTCSEIIPASDLRQPLCQHRTLRREGIG
eukprot:2237849-Rhodomonas_salina.1